MMWCRSGVKTESLNHVHQLISFKYLIQISVKYSRPFGMGLCRRKNVTVVWKIVGINSANYWLIAIWEVDKHPIPATFGWKKLNRNSVLNCYGFSPNFAHKRKNEIRLKIERFQFLADINLVPRIILSILQSFLHSLKARDINSWYRNTETISHGNKRK